MRQTIADEILESTDEAIQALRREHTSALEAALNSRERLIAELMGFPAGKPLPAFNPSWDSISARKYARTYQAKFIDIQKSETILFQLFHYQQHKLSQFRGKLRCGRRYTEGVRRTLEIHAGRRFDRQG